MEATSLLWHEVTRQCSRGIRGVFLFREQVNENLISAGWVQLHDSTDMPSCVAPARAVPQGPAIARSKRFPSSPHALDICPNERSQLFHVLRHPDLCNGRSEFRFLFAVEVVLAKHDPDTALQVSAESFPKVIVDDADRLLARVFRLC